MNPDSKWHNLVHDNIKITLVAHVAIKGRQLGTITLEEPDKAPESDYDQVELEVFAGPMSTDELLLLNQLKARASAKLRKMQLELADIKSYRFCLKD